VRRFQAIFFDLGDTLVRGRPQAPSFGRIAAELGVDATEAQVRAAIAAVGPRAHLGPEALYRRRRESGWRVTPDADEARRLQYFGSVFEALGLGDRAAEAARRLRASYQGAERWEVYADVPAVLEQLRAAGYTLGVISNWARRLDEVCAALDLARHFEFVLASDEEGYMKPHPHMFERALALAGTPARAALYVGDSYVYDVEGARGAGLAAVLIDRRGAHREPPHRPIIRTLDELPPLLDAADTWSWSETAP